MPEFHEMWPWQKSLLFLVLLWSIASTSAQWKPFPLVGKNNGFDKNSGEQKMPTTTIEDFHRNRGGELERHAAEKMPGKPEEEFDRMTHGMTPTGVVGVEMKNVDTEEEEHPKTGEQSEFQTGKTQRKRVKTSRRRWRQNGANILGKSKITSGREGKSIRKRGEDRLGVWGKGEADERKERRKWGVNTLSVWGKRNDKEKGEGDDGEHADDTLKEHRPEADGSKPEADGSKPEMTTSAANNRGSDARGRRLRKRRSIDDIYEDSVDWFPVPAAAAVSHLSKRSKKPRRRSVPAPYNGPKRNWETNTMKVWGKRGGARPTWEEYFYSAEPNNGKRKWTSNNAVRMWGKRDSPPPPSDDEEEDLFSRLYDAFEN